MDASSSQKTILFVHHGKGLGGAPLSLLYLIQALDKNRYHPIVLFLYQSDVIELYRSHGIQTMGPLNLMDFPHTKIWWFRWYHLRPLIRSMLDTYKTMHSVAPRILSAVRPDIIHLNTSSLIAWAYAAHKKGIPVVWHIREPLADGYCGIRKLLVRASVQRFANTIVPICNDNAHPWAHDLRTHVVYNAVPKERFNSEIACESFLARYNLDRHRPKILFLGGISHEKGTRFIIEIFEQLRAQLPSVMLLIAGAHEYQKPIRYSLKNLFPAAQLHATVERYRQKYSDSLVLLGPINDVPEAMAASSVIVFPATVGHFARPIIEAGFMRKPTIASDLPALDELIIHEQTGFLITPHDYAGWVNTLYKLLTDEIYNRTVGAAAYTFCSQKFSMSHHVDQIQKIYQSIECKETSV